MVQNYTKNYIPNIIQILNRQLYILCAELGKIVSVAWISTYLYYKLLYDLQKLITCLTVLVILIFQCHPSSFNFIKLMWSVLFDKVDLCMTVGGFDPSMSTIFLPFTCIYNLFISFFVLASFHAISYVYYKSNWQTLAWLLYLMLTIDDGLLFLCVNILYIIKCGKICRYF